MANPAKDLLCHSAKKRKFCQKQPGTIQPLTLMRQRCIAPGRTRMQGFGESPEKKLSPHIGNRALQKNSILGYMLLTVDHLQFCFLSVWYAGGIVWRRLRRIRNLKSLRSLIFAIAILYPTLQSSISYATAGISIPFVCYRQTLISFPVRNKWRISPTAV